MNKIKKKKFLKAFGRIQDLAGKAKNIYLNDRDPMQADKLIPVLDEIFKIALDIRSAEPLEEVR